MLPRRLRLPRRRVLRATLPAAPRVAQRMVAGAMSSRPLRAQRVRVPFAVPHAANATVTHRHTRETASQRRICAGVAMLSAAGQKEPPRSKFCRAVRISAPLARRAVPAAGWSPGR